MRKLADISAFEQIEPGEVSVFNTKIEVDTMYACPLARSVSKVEADLLRASELVSVAQNTIMKSADQLASIAKEILDRYGTDHPSLFKRIKKWILPSIEKEAHYEPILLDRTKMDL